MEGTYTDVYMDYEDGHLFVLNDWRSRSQDIPPDCYNAFSLRLGGQDVALHVYGDGHVEVFGAELDSDGAYGLGTSPAWDSPHTIYEFSLAVAPGQIDMCCTDPVSGGSCEMRTEPITYSIVAGDAPRAGRTIPRTVERLGEGEGCDRGVCGAGLTCAPATHRCARVTVVTTDAALDLDAAVEQPDAGHDASLDAPEPDAPLL